MTSDLDNLVYSCLIDGTGDHALITLEEAAYTLQCWQEEGAEVFDEIENLSPAEFMHAWNRVYNELCA